MAPKHNPIFPKREKAAQEAAGPRVRRSRGEVEDTGASAPERQLQMELVTTAHLKAVREGKTKKSWACVGIDTSMTAIAMCGIGYDAVRDQMTKVKFADMRWTPEIDYIQRLGLASKAHELMWTVLPGNVPLERVWIAQEEPVPLGMMGGGKVKFESGWIKQQCEVSGAVIGSLSKYGYPNIFQINNSQWRKALRDEGQTIRQGGDGKWDVKAWAIQAYGLPDLSDLVKGKNGGKIPRPESGYGAKAKAVQPDDVYDAAACLAWMTNHVESGGLI